MFNACLNFSKELKKIGLQFMLSGLLFGSLGIITVSSVSFNKALRAKGRSSLIIISIVFGIIAFIPFNKIIFSYFPIILINSLILYTGCKLSALYFIKKYHQYDYLEYGLIAITAIVTVLYGFNQGLLSGGLLSLILFIFHIQKIELTSLPDHKCSKIRHGMIDYTTHYDKRIDQEKATLHCIYLHGNIFFGNCFNIFFIIRDLFEKHNKTDCYIILNFKYVTGIDISAANYFRTISFLVTCNKKDIVLCNISNTILQKIKCVFKNNTVPFKVFKDNDLAVKNIQSLLQEYITKGSMTHQHRNIQLIESHWK